MSPVATFLAGYTASGGAWKNPRGGLRVKGLIDFRDNRVSLTGAGRALAETPAAPLTREALHAKVMSRLPGPEQKLLKPLLASYPDVLSDGDLADATGYTASGGAFKNPRGRLRMLGLIEYRDGGIAARSILFPD